MCGTPRRTDVGRSVVVRSASGAIRSTSDGSEPRPGAARSRGAASLDPARERRDRRGDVDGAGAPDGVGARARSTTTARGSGSRCSSRRTGARGSAPASGSSSRSSSSRVLPRVRLHGPLPLRPAPAGAPGPRSLARARRARPRPAGRALRPLRQRGDLPQRPRRARDRGVLGSTARGLGGPGRRADDDDAARRRQPARRAPRSGLEPFDGLPAGTVMGHVHLKVASIADTVAFYRDVLGFGLMAQLGPQAAFFAAGGYHHLGSNVWESAGAAPAARGDRGAASCDRRPPGWRRAGTGRRSRAGGGAGGGRGRRRPARPRPIRERPPARGRLASRARSAPDRLELIVRVALGHRRRAEQEHDPEERRADEEVRHQLEVDVVAEPPALPCVGEELDDRVAARPDDTVGPGSGELGLPWSSPRSPGRSRPTRGSANSRSWSRRCSRRSS